MLVRFSKYDFWIPEQILDFKNFVPEKNNVSWDEKYFSEKCRKNIFWNIFEKSKISKNFIENQYSRVGLKSDVRLKWKSPNFSESSDLSGCPT